LCASVNLITDLPNFLSPLEEEVCDIALGSRFLKKETKKLVPMKKRILLRGARLITRFLSGIKLTDAHNGYRVMSRKAAKMIDIGLDRYEHASDIIDQIAKKKIIFKEVPTYVDYTEYSESRGQKMSNSIKILLKMIFKKS
jgi:hypothetical protein